MSTSKIFNLIGKVICYLLIALGLIFAVLIVINSGKIQTDVALQDRFVLPCVYISIVAILLALIIAVVLPLFFTTYTKKQILKVAAIVVAVIVLLVICWMIPDVPLSEEFMSNPDLNVNETISKFVGVGAYFTYFVFAASLITVAFAAISNLLKKGN